MIIDIDTATDYLKADSDDEDLITAMIAGAQSICQGYCNRVFYATQDDANADFTQALLDQTAQKASYKALLAGTTDTDQKSLITNHYIEVFGRIKQRVNGVVIDDTITAAMLLTLGHLYANREDNVASGNNVVQVPVGAQRILQPYLWIGDIADNVPEGYEDGCWTPGS